MALLQFNGLREFADYLGDCAKRTNLVAARALNDSSHDLLAATIPFTPIDYGPLRASGRVHNSGLMGSTITCDVVFGGAAAGYAIYVHEKVFTRRGNKVFHASPTKAKFLSETGERDFPRLSKMDGCSP